MSARDSKGRFVKAAPPADVPDFLPPIGVAAVFMAAVAAVISVGMAVYFGGML